MFCPSDLHLDLITFMYEVDPYCLEIHGQDFRNLLSDMHTYIQTDRHDRNYIPRRFAGG